MPTGPIYWNCIYCGGTGHACDGVASIGPKPEDCWVKPASECHFCRGTGKVQVVRPDDPDDSYARGFAAGLEAAADRVAQLKGGYSAAIRTSADEQEFVRDPDGPWVLNADAAAAIRGLKP